MLRGTLGTIPLVFPRARAMGNVHQVYSKSMVRVSSCGRDANVHGGLGTWWCKFVRVDAAGKWENQTRRGHTELRLVDNMMIIRQVYGVPREKFKCVSASEQEPDELPKRTLYERTMS